MKYNIKQTDFKGNCRNDGKWWSWEQKCDHCGADCQHTGIMTTAKPDTDEVDFCIQCYRELMDQNIPYKKAYEMYKKETRGRASRSCPSDHPEEFLDSLAEIGYH